MRFSNEGGIFIRNGELFVIHELRREGSSISAIAWRTGLDRKTVRKYLKRSLTAPSYGTWSPRRTSMESMRRLRHCGMCQRKVQMSPFLQFSDAPFLGFVRFPRRGPAAGRRLGAIPFILIVPLCVRRLRRCPAGSSGSRDDPQRACSKAGRGCGNRRVQAATNLRIAISSRFCCACQRS